MELYNFFSGTTSDVLKSEHSDFPNTIEHVWILGKRYNALHDLEDLRAVVRKKIWFTYRNNFLPIGGTGPVSDKHWGCMLRCGQMVMAEALFCKHLGRGWQCDLRVADPVYSKILKMFQDKKNSPYSIHQIAQMGVSEGKAVGQWFGPNTVAQVLRKLSIYDEWSSMAVHVALDNAVIKADIRTLCTHAPESVNLPSSMSHQSVWYVDCVTRNCPKWQTKRTSYVPTSWRPMLLFIPLRLGLSSLNPVYIRSVKSTFAMKQSLGIIGGKPRHALWFIGYVGNDLVCLDPHTTQPSIDLDGGSFDDSTFHVPYGGSKRMPITDIDPSIALCFFFESEADFNNWCVQVEDLLILPEKQPLFELLNERPQHWPPLELRPDLNCSNCSYDYFFVEHDKDDTLSSEEFVMFDSLTPNSST